MRIGITQYTAGVGGLELLEQTAGMGLNGVEPMIATADSDYLLWSADEIEAFLRRANELGILVPTAAMAVFYSDDSLINKDGRDKAVKIIRRGLEFARAMGATTLMLCTYAASDPDSPAKKANLVEVLQKTAPVAQDLQVAVGLESPLSAAQLADIIEQVDSQWLGVYYDVGNAVYLGYDPGEEIQQLGRQILSVHMKDTAKEIGDSHLGHGRLDLNHAIESLRKISYDGWLMLETPPKNNLAIQDDIRLLREHLTRLEHQL